MRYVAWSFAKEQRESFCSLTDANTTSVPLGAGLNSKDIQKITPSEFNQRME